MPDWVCEILSPTTAWIDHNLKMPVYGRYGVAHAWVVDPGEQTVETYRLDAVTWTSIATFSGDKAIRAALFDAVAIPASRSAAPES